MSKAILGTKLGMSQVFAENGDLVPVSVIEVLPNVVAAVKYFDMEGREGDADEKTLWGEVTFSF